MPETNDLPYSQIRYETPAPKIARIVLDRPESATRRAWS